ncbi:hypothetical protein [Gordonia sp. CPCC 205333]|uniref:hypothetical protein n=1 Tax=Gordonia sp. CPCC 205333 TaxID=3140790 RepID=UPI003AF383DD
MTKRGGAQLAAAALAFTLILISSLLVIGRPTTGQPYANQAAALRSWLDQASERDKMEAPFTASVTSTLSGRDEVVITLPIEISKPSVQVAIRVACFSTVAKSNLMAQKETFFATLNGTDFGAGSCSSMPDGPSPIKDSSWIGISLETMPYPVGLRNFTFRVVLPGRGLLAASATIRYIA